MRLLHRTPNEVFFIYVDLFHRFNFGYATSTKFFPLARVGKYPIDQLTCWMHFWCIGWNDVYYFGHV